MPLPRSETDGLRPTTDELLETEASIDPQRADYRRVSRAAEALIDGPDRFGGPPNPSDAALEAWDRAHRPGKYARGGR